MDRPRPSAPLSIVVLLVVVVLLSVVVVVTVASQRRLDRRTNGDNEIRRRWNNDEESTTSFSSVDPFDGRRLPKFRRDGVVVPEWSIDSRECDDFGDPRECTVADGYVACFECVESRASLRVCVHLDEPLTIAAEADDSFAATETITLPANSSSRYGYCLSERLARAVRDQRIDANGDSAASRRACSALNANWLLVRRRALGDGSYNFACRCKYPHLMTNVAGPQSSCSRDVACNGHGRLDDDARNSRTDPFVNGRCVCDDGWISEYDDSAGLGPYCREATFAEWPSAFYGEKLRDDDIELYSDAVDRAFRRAIMNARRDGNVDVWLPNPCGPCDLVRGAEATSYFCGDRVEIDDTEGLLSLVHLGVRRDRDFLRGNGGRLPNSCVTFRGDGTKDSGRIWLQYMSQSWNDGSQFAQEIGFVVETAQLQLMTPPGSFDDPTYREFTELLAQPHNRSALQGYGVAWTYASADMREHRKRVCDRLVSLMPLTRTDLCYPNERVSWYDFPYYTYNLIANRYYLLDRTVTRELGYRFQTLYNCPDLRGLDDLWHSAGRETDEATANRAARGMTPVCMVRHERDNGTCVTRPELNCSQDNPTACVLVVFPSIAVYAYALWYPRDMNALRFCEKRNRGNERNVCP